MFCLMEFPMAAFENEKKWEMPDFLFYCWANGIITNWFDWFNAWMYTVTPILPAHASSLVESDTMNATQMLWVHFQQFVIILSFLNLIDNFAVWWVFFRINQAYQIILNPILTLKNCKNNFESIGIP